MNRREWMHSGLGTAAALFAVGQVRGDEPVDDSDPASERVGCVLDEKWTLERVLGSGGWIVAGLLIGSLGLEATAKPMRRSRSAAFAPSIADSSNLTRAVDNLQQWLLTAKMRAKRDGLATGIRFIQAQGDPPGFFSQVQYIQQPDDLNFPNTMMWQPNQTQPNLVAINGQRASFQSGGQFPVPRR